MKEYKGQRIENLYAFLKGTKEDEIIGYTVFMGENRKFAEEIMVH